MTNSTRNCKPVTFTTSNEQFSTASFITIEFGGYFNCRQTTDPDPTDDPYGTSGYTMALTGEPVLDQVIRTQWDPKKSDLRPNGVFGLCDKVKAGVLVQKVSLNGNFCKSLTEKLAGAKVNLAADTLNDASGNPNMMDPMFISNNNVVGSDDTMAFVIEPFNLQITKNDLEIHAVDVLSTSNPNKSAIEFDMPADYARRLSYKLIVDSPAAHQAIGVFDEYGYFRARRQWLAQQIEMYDKMEARLDRFISVIKGDVCDDETLQWFLEVLNTTDIKDRLATYLNGCLLLLTLEDWQRELERLEETALHMRTHFNQERQNCKTRIFQIESWGVRVTNKLGFQTFWKHDINCTREVNVCGNEATKAQMEDLLGGEVISDQPWFADYWFGSWDGDLLIGYMSGTLQIPFKPAVEDS